MKIKTLVQLRVAQFSVAQFSVAMTLTLLTNTAWAKSDSSGLGVILGDPTGLTGKFWTASDRAIDAGLAFSLDNFVLIYGDYLFHFPGAFGTSSAFLHELKPYVGIGGELFFSSSDRKNSNYFAPSGSSGSSVGFGVRIPLGAEWIIPRAPLGIFIELVPGIGIAPGTFAFFQGGIGIRYYF